MKPANIAAVTTKKVPVYVDLAPKISTVVLPPGNVGIVNEPDNAPLLSTDNVLYVSMPPIITDVIVSESTQPVPVTDTTVPTAPDVGLKTTVTLLALSFASDDIPQIIPPIPAITTTAATAFPVLLVGVD